MRIDERPVPVREDVRGACEILGLDPLYVANEGRFVAFVAARDAGRALEVLRASPAGSGARRIGEVGGILPARCSSGARSACFACSTFRAASRFPASVKASFGNSGKSPG